MTPLLPRLDLGMPEAPPAVLLARNALLGRLERTAATITAMRAARRCVQLAAGALDDPPLAAPIESVTLALMETDEARAAVAALSPTQRVRQAIAQAAWLSEFGYPVSHEELLASWAADDVRPTG